MRPAPWSPTSTTNTARSWLQFSRKRSAVVLTYGWERGDFHAENVDINPRGTRFDMATPQEKIPIFSPLIGRVNVYNILAAAAACYCARMRIARRLLGASNRSRMCREDLSASIAGSRSPSSWTTRTPTTPYAISRRWPASSSRAVGERRRVLTVFGCGGDRDRAKRPLMGEAAGRGSDFVVLTSDNPRSEDPRAIINDALVGLQKTGVKYTVEVDRRKAIALAIAEARPGDIVLLAGKGHEKVQVTREGSHPV